MKPTWRADAEPPALGGRAPAAQGPIPPSLRVGCLAGWIALLSKRPPAEESIPLRVSTGLTVLLAIVASLHQMEWPGYGWAVLVLTTGGFIFSWFGRHRNRWGLKAALSILSLAVLVRFLYSLYASLHDPRLPLAELLLWLQTLHSFDVPARRDLNYSMVVGLILISLGAVLSTSSGYGIYLAAFLLCALVAAHYQHLSRISEGLETPPPPLRRVERPGELIPTLLKTSLTLALAGAGFYLCLPRYESMRLRAMPVSWEMRLRLPRIGRGEVINPAYPTQAGDTRRDRTRFNPDSYHGFNARVDLGLRGALSDAPVMKVRSSRWSYYRGLAFTGYDGFGWRLPEGRPREVTTSTPPLLIPLDRESLGSEQTVQIFYLDREQPNVVFAPFQPYQVFFPSEVLYVDAALGLRAPFPLEEGMVYSVLGLSDTRSGADLKKLPPVSRYPQLARSPQVQLPANLPERVRALAREIAAPYRSPYEQALALTLFLQRERTYETPPPPYPPGAEVTDWFLFESGRGHCEQFATALVVMARSLGLPARYVTGYLPGTYNPFTGMYEVKGTDAHAWAEIFLPGHGWMAFDPTPTGQGSTTPTLEAAARPRWMISSLLAYLKERIPPARRQEARAAWETSKERALGALQALGSSIREDGRGGWALRAALAAGLLGAALGAGLRSLRRARRSGRWGPMARLMDRALGTWAERLLPPSTPTDALRGLYLEALALLEQAGTPRTPSQTARELAREADARWGGTALSELTRLFEQARYGRGEPGPDHLARARALVEAIRARLEGQEEGRG